jgi:uncharacterized membrane protein YfcA
MDSTSIVIIASGIIVGIFASFTGFGSRLIMVPLLFYLGFTAQKAVGISFPGIFVIAVSALVAHNKLVIIYPTLI